MRGLLAVTIGAAALAAAPAVAATKHPKPLTVKVGDDYFLPAKKTVPRGTTVVWKWLAGNANTHDVKLKKGPKGVKKFHSAPAAADFTFKRTLKVKGTYRVICTFHEGMVQTLVVK